MDRGRHGEAKKAVVLIKNTAHRIAAREGAASVSARRKGRPAPGGWAGSSLTLWMATAVRRVRVPEMKEEANFTTE